MNGIKKYDTLILVIRSLGWFRKVTCCLAACFSMFT